MISPLSIRLMTPDDLAFANSLREAVRWNQTRQDWHRLLTHDPKGCFVAEWEGVPAGTATTTCYGKELAWIGMVLVHPDYRRRGLGRALMEHCLSHLRENGIQCVKLDATPVGKTLYDQLGFHDEWTLTRWETSKPVPTKTEPTGVVRLWRESDLREAAEIDRQVFGAHRPRMLVSLAASSRLALTCETGGRVAGFGMLREGTRAAYLGPVAALSEETGILLVQCLLTNAANEPVFWDVPDQNIAAKSLATKLGFAPQRPLIRMFLHDINKPGIPARQYAIADPGIG